MGVRGSALVETMSRNSPHVHLKAADEKDFEISLGQSVRVGVCFSCAFYFPQDLSLRQMKLTYLPVRGTWLVTRSALLRLTPRREN